MTYAIERAQAVSVATRIKTLDGARRVLARVLEGIDELADGLNSGALSVAEWREAMADLLAVGHIAGWQEGRDQNDLGRLAREAINRELREQARYLNRFAAEVDARGWDDRRDRARAALYAGAIKSTYWRGATFGLSLPRYPGDGGTACMGNCKCRLRVVWLDEEELDADVYWEMGGAERHCRDCPRLAAAWAPLRIRGGRPS